MENIEENAKRMMTVVCAEESEFFVLDKEDYVSNGLDVLQQQEFQVRLEFFRSADQVLAGRGQSFQRVWGISFSLSIFRTHNVVTACLVEIFGNCK